MAAKHFTLSLIVTLALSIAAVAQGAIADPNPEPNPQSGAPMCDGQCIIIPICQVTNTCPSPGRDWDPNGPGTSQSGNWFNTSGQGQTNLTGNGYGSGGITAGDYAGGPGGAGCCALKDITSAQWKGAFNPGSSRSSLANWAGPLGYGIQVVGNLLGLLCPAPIGCGTVAGLDLPAGLSMEEGAGGAASAANAARLSRQLTLEEAESAFTANGELSADAIANSKEIIPSTQLKVVRSGQVPPGFAKFSTRTYKSPAGPFQVHFYMNPTTRQVFYGLDYKVIFNVARP